MSLGFHSKLYGRLSASARGGLGVAAAAFCLVAPPTSVAATKEQLRPLDPAERGLIGKLNAERQLVTGPAGEPLPRLSVSSALTQAASDYADYLRVTGQFDHGADGRTAAERAREAGWTPAPASALAVGEDLFEGTSAEAAYSAWKSSPSHAAVLFHPDAYWVGLGRSADKWVLLVGGQCAQAECELTTDREQTTAFRAAPSRPVLLRFLLRRRGRTVAVHVRAVRGEGRALVHLRRADGRPARRLRRNRRGDLWRYVFRLPSKGRWRASVRFSGDRGWAKEIVRLRPFTVRD